MEAQSQCRNALSTTENLSSLSQTSPINNVTNTGTTPAVEDFPRVRKHSRTEATTRQRRAAAVQVAKREVLANIQEGWTWPPTADQLGNKFPRRRKSTQWQERESDDTTWSQPSRSSSPTEIDRYRYESPDTLDRPHTHGRAKRRKLVTDELTWNEGLRVFLERRDFWTGATFRFRASHQRQGKSSNPERNPNRQSACSISPTLRPPGDIPPTTAASNSPESDLSSSVSMSTDSLSMPISQSSSAATSTRTSQSSEIIPPSGPILHPTPTSSEVPPISLEPFTTATRTLIPLAPPLLSPNEHPYLTPITPVLYPALYSKCIVQALAPSVPINLSHIVGCLVQGWKDDGEWPPKSNVAEENGTARGRKGSLRGKMRSLRIDIEGDGAQVGLERVARKSVGKVKKALGG
ncbi:MAG: hypothetical protein LQ337_000798 [Flavoplaca oasis]|nr:MAG: hypothetical protein LQ337_000798 [Flavoplaca oasis]